MEFDPLETFQRVARSEKLTYLRNASLQPAEDRELCVKANRE